MMPLYDRLLVNAAAVLSARVFEGLLQLAVLAFILGQTSREYYAAALLILSVQATVDLARGGMQKATLKFIAEHRARHDYTSANAVLSSSVVLQGGVGFLGFLTCIAVAPFASQLFALPVHLAGEAQWAMIALGAAIAASFALSPWHNALAAMERYDLVSIVRVGSRVFRAVLIVALLLFGAPPVLGLVISYGLADTVNIAACRIFNRRIDPLLRFSLPLVSWTRVRSIFSFSLLDSLHTLSGFLYTQGSLLLAAHLASLQATASLGIISTITALLGLVMNQFAQMLVPVASRLQAEGNFETIRQIVLRGTAITVCVGGAFMVGIIPWVDSLLSVWLGREYAVLAAPAIVLLSAAYLMQSLTCVHNPLGGIGKIAFDSTSSVLCTLAGLGIAAMLVQGFGLDVMGIAIGLLFARASRFLTIAAYGSRAFGISLRKLAWIGYARSFLVVAALATAFALIHVTLDSWGAVIVSGAVSSSTYLAVAGPWIIGRSEGARLWKATRAALSHSAPARF